MNNYQVIAKIGRGTYGTVLKCRKKTTGAIVAIKLTKLLADRSIPKSARQERMLLKKLQHPNVVRLLGELKSHRCVLLILEYCHTDLSQYLHQLHEGSMLEQNQLKRFLYQIADGIQYCHEQKVMHRDLKPSNVLINPEQGVVKVADFGMACSFAGPKRSYSNKVVTRYYRPPELLLGSTDYSWPVDIWSIGCIFAELASRKVLFPGDTKLLMLFCIFDTFGTPTLETWPNVTSLPYYDGCLPCWTEDRLVEAVTNLDEAGMDLLRKCLVCNPAGRISAKQILEHNYFSGFQSANSSTES